MTDSVQSFRLNLITKQFNLKREEIVDFLATKGYTIDKNPNTKITPEQFALLAGHFKLKKVEEKPAEPVAKNDSTTFIDLLTSSSIKAEEKKEPIKPTVIHKPKIKEEVKQIEVEITKEKVEEKVEEKSEENDDSDKKYINKLKLTKVGKIDLKPKKKEEEKPIEVVKPKEEIAKEQEIVTEKKEAKKHKTEIAEHIETTPIKETEVKPKETHSKETFAKKPKFKREEHNKTSDNKQKSKETYKKPFTKKETRPEVDNKPEVDDNISFDHDVFGGLKNTTFKKNEADEIVEQKNIEPTEVVPSNNDVEDLADNNEKRSDFQINLVTKGKIDLTSINSKTKPDKKFIDEQKKLFFKKEKPSKDNKFKKPFDKDKKETKEGAVSEPKKFFNKNTPDKKDNNFFRKDKKFGPNEAKDSNENKVNRDNRPTGTNTEGKDKTDNKPNDFKKAPIASSDNDIRYKKKRKRINDPNVPFGNAAPNTEAKPGAPYKKGRFNKDKPKFEVSQDAVDKQIKETYAKLSPTGKSKSAKYRKQKRDLISQQYQQELVQNEEDKSTLKVTEFVSANELANLMNVHVNEVISKCLGLGVFISINQRLDAEIITLVADEFGYSVDFVSVDDQEIIEEEIDKEDDLIFRPPIVTVMGHVDHGKTSLLDYIRKANVIAGEAGGITQHIGAYEVTLSNGKSITFLDTPGHEAFTAMRARGAKITDIVIIVVAADDNVMPQTIEAINHAKAAGVPIVIAINKIDKPAANVEKIKEELSKINVLVEDWGGKFQSQEISAKKGINVDLLLEKVLLEAEMLDLKANPNKNAAGTVIESSLDKGKGYVTKILVQTGTLRVGDIILAGSYYGKVKAMYNERGKLIKEAKPSTPLLLLGLNGAPQAGDKFNMLDDEKSAKNIANKRQQIQREQGIRTKKHVTLDEIGRRIAVGDFKELNIIVKGDVDGSIEALSDSLLKLSAENVQVNVIHKSVGQITESDVLLASASNAIIIGFQVRPSLSARKLAEQEEIDIRMYSIIYTAINEIKSAIEGMLSPDIEEKVVCTLIIKEVFKITKVGTIAGCFVNDGKIQRNTKVRLIRDGVVMYDGVLGSLKRYKDDVKDVNAGMECGLNIENFNDIKVDDIIEGYDVIETKKKL